MAHFVRLGPAGGPSYFELSRLRSRRVRSSLGGEQVGYFGAVVAFDIDRHRRYLPTTRMENESGSMGPRGGRPPRPCGGAPDAGGVDGGGPYSAAIVRI